MNEKGRSLAWGAAFFVRSGAIIFDAGGWEIGWEIKKG
jgi:hypothetical protein